MMDNFAGWLLLSIIYVCVAIGAALVVWRIADNLYRLAKKTLNR